MNQSESENAKREDRKIERVLSLWNVLSHGRSVSRHEVADMYHVNERTVSRYFQDLRKYLEQLQNADGIPRKLIYDTEDKKYHIQEMENRYISNGELFGICKILLASRAFCKEEMKSLMGRLLQTAVPMKEKEVITDYIEKELFDYRDPKHKAPDMDTFWKITQAVDNHRVLKFNYKKMNASYSTIHRVRPLGVFFSEYYFYLVGWPYKGEDDEFSTKSYRLDRMSGVEEIDATFQIPYADRFKEGEYKNRIQYMFGGKEEYIRFTYTGYSIEAVLDRLPTAKARKQGENTWLVEADIQGEGILMWLLSQGSRVNVLYPTSLRERWLGEAKKICDMAEESHI